MPVTDPYMKLAGFGAYVLCHAAREGAVDPCVLRELATHAGLIDGGYVFTPDIASAITDLTEQDYE